MRREKNVVSARIRPAVSLNRPAESRHSRPYLSVVKRYDTPKKGSHHPTHQLLDHRLDQIREIQPLVRLTVVDVFAQHSDCLGIGIGSEDVSTFLENELDFFVYRSGRKGRRWGREEG